MPLFSALERRFSLTERKRQEKNPPWWQTSSTITSCMLTNVVLQTDYINTRILLENTPLIKLILNHIWDSDGIFSISLAYLWRYWSYIILIVIVQQLFIIVVIFVGVWSEHLQICLESLCKSLVIFENVWKMFKNVCVGFKQFLENYWKSLKRGHKSSENCQKCRYQSVYRINKIILVAFSL